MNASTHRTCKTDLSDDELIICDFLWPNELRIPEKLLLREIFPEIANIPYSHSISDENLGRFLDSMVAREILNSETVLMATRRAEAPSLQRVFGLTHKGGTEWEKERAPDWSTFVNDIVSLDDETNLVLSLSESLGRSYIDTCLESGIWRLAGDIEHVVAPLASLVPWKSFNSVHQFKVPIMQSDGTERMDFSVYHARRAWWGDTKELLAGVPRSREI